ncbi:hypothetical protein Tco_0127173 [Tanacetum coccineum]
MRRILRCIAKTYDEVQAGIDADALFVAKLQQKEKEGDFIHLKREKLSKNMGGYEHSQLKAKHLQKIQVKDSIEATGVIAKGFLKNITVLREEVSTPIEPLLRDCYSLKMASKFIKEMRLNGVWMGGNGKFSIHERSKASFNVTWGLGSQGFKASTLYLNSALGTSWDLLDQILAAIDR